MTIHLCEYIVYFLQTFCEYNLKYSIKRWTHDIKLSSFYNPKQIQPYMYYSFILHAVHDTGRKYENLYCKTKKKICVFTVTRPTLIFASDPMNFYTEFG